MTNVRRTLKRFRFLWGHHKKRKRTVLQGFDTLASATGGSTFTGIALIAQRPLAFAALLLISTAGAHVQDAYGAGAAGAEQVNIDLTTPEGPFIACPSGLLHAAWATVLTETALDTFAVEQEVLRLCAERQEVINDILRRDADRARLVATPLPATPEPASPSAAAPTPKTASDTGSATTRSTADIQRLPINPVPNAIPARFSGIAPAASAPVETVTPAGSWTHLVRWRVRSEAGPWRAEIASIFTPPAPLPLPRLNADGITVWDLQPAPTPAAPVFSIVAAGGTLPDGQVIAEINDKDVLVRPAGAIAQSPEPLRSDPNDLNRGPRGSQFSTAPEPAAARNTCLLPATADARDLIHCKVPQL